MTGVLTGDVDGILETLLADAPDPVIVVDPPEIAIEEYVDVATAMNDPPIVRLLADETILKEALGDFLVAGHAADLIDANVLELRTPVTSPGNALITTESQLATLVVAGEMVGALSADEPTFVTHAFEYFSKAWDAADDFTLRTPPLSRVRETLRASIGPKVADDFDAVLNSLDTARGNNGLDEVTISLLVAAKNQELLYDISKWGEDVGIASKATFSRTKTSLEDLGLIDTEKVPIDVGRPRLRLRFANEQLNEATADELASVAKSLMA